MDHAHAAAPSRESHRGSRQNAIEAIYATGHWLLARERLADAAKVFRTMIQAAPRDERGWLGLGECHERIDQRRIAAQLYGAGSVAASASATVRSVRCLIALGRVLSKLELDVDAEHAIDAAADAADAQDDDTLKELVAEERRRMS
jgi:thioredoxin-like negative regulator of GroEL